MIPFRFLPQIANDPSAEPTIEKLIVIVDLVSVASNLGEIWCRGISRC